ncbi:MAG: AMP-dependent synthetase [Rhodobacteraceae bacterium]|nr:AMP-dependent synthetase [Paracoccaceae bacterium]
MSATSAGAIFARMTADGDLMLAQLDRWAAETPDKVFLHYGEDGVRLTFAEVAAHADRLAAGLAGQGIGKGDRVAVLTRNSLVAALSLFGIFRAGAVYAPINFNLTGGLLAYQLSDAAPALLITDPSFLPALAPIRDEIRIPALALHHPAPGDHDFEPAPEIPAGLPAPLDLAELAAPGRPVPRVEVGPFDPAAIIYTSGTTGPAKGVLLGHRWINQYSFFGRPLANADDAIYCDLPMYHVAGAFWLLGVATWSGQTIGIWDKFSPARFWDRIAECGATSATLLDVMIPRLMSAPERPDDRDNTLMRVHMQPFNANHHAFARRFGIDIVTVGFGQTESGAVFAGVIDEFPEGQGTPAAFWRGMSKADILAAARDLGRVIFDGREDLPKGLMGAINPLYELGVLDETDAPVAPGEVGQLCLRPRVPGMILQGYINKPEATLKVLSNCWFHTGDAVRCVDEARGLHVFVDRMGGFFRVRGENVSSFEVETALARHPAVRAAAAIPLPAAEGDEDDIAAFVELEDGAALTVEELAAHAAAEMPKYMRPRHLRILDALPVTPTSKIEKYKLRAALLAELDAEKAPA